MLLGGHGLSRRRQTCGSPDLVNISSWFFVACTYGLECGDFGFLRSIVDGILHVIDGEAAIGSPKLVVSKLFHALVCPILSAKIKYRGPVV